MTIKYAGFLTDLGLAIDANSKVSGQPVVFDKLVFSSSEEPVEQSWTEMPDVVAEVVINDVRITAEDANVALAEAILPPELGGFWIRSAGILDTNGNLYAVSNLSPSYKPALAEGAAEDLLQIIKFVSSNAANIKVSIDPSIVRATRPWVESQLDPIRYATSLALVKSYDNRLAIQSAAKNNTQGQSRLEALINYTNQN